MGMSVAAMAARSASVCTLGSSTNNTIQILPEPLWGPGNEKMGVSGLAL
jgi:hypothetical protein